MSKPPLDVGEVLQSFGGMARLFPLPAVVMFPDGIAPLRVFEDRYVKMVEDAVPDDGLIATALIKAGAFDESEYSQPEIHPVVCLGKIIRQRREANGHIELILYGLARGKVVEEIPSHPYRQARIELLDDVVPPGNDEVVAQRLRRALDLIPGRQGMVWGMRQMAERIRGVDAAPGRYADAVAHACDLAPDALYAILEEVDVLRRFERLIQVLEDKASEDAPRVGVQSPDPRWN